VLNRQEIELLITALAYYEKEGLSENIAMSVMAQALSFAQSDSNDPAEYVNKAQIEVEQKQEQVVLLRAKLIQMKDKAIAEEVL
jgi:hypothetical protein